TVRLSSLQLFKTASEEGNASKRIVKEQFSLGGRTVNHERCLDGAGHLAPEGIPFLDADSVVGDSPPSIGEESDSSFVDSCSVSNSSDTEDSSVWKVSKKVSEMLSGSKNSFPVSHSKHCTRISAPVILEQEAICGSKETSSGCWTQGPPKSPQAAAAASSREQEVPVALVVMKKQGTDGDAGDRPYKCEQCGWAFKKASNLRSHEETHRGLKSHVCELCGKAYSHQGTLQQHRRLHTGERPYSCPFCARTYIWSSDFRKHIRTHTGEKPYACATCGKAFVRSSDLRKHERNIHANDKPLPCPQCGKTFNKPLSLLRHQRTHLGESPSPC
uniref:Zinc finger protein 648 n=1 Tax=Scleropages formosus TaxID=113540 RepID=A0A8C9WCA1_SCLFO